ncbi:PFL_4695 family integrating conjugative element protein [Vibrio ostreicida]|uniref:PFL_4695 family integrating conjugative element protein n=1 Tax=Vibrio ostreicida TaxID=526588 RepID=UPI003B5C9405
MGQWVNAAIPTPLVEIATVGNIQPVSPLLPNIQFDESDVERLSETLMKKATDSISKEMFFPLESKMSVGRVENRQFSEKLRLRPFAVAGVDDVSIRWLTQRGSVLANMRSPIYIVQAQSMADIQRISHQFPALRFVPSSGDGLSKELNLKHYPVLINESGVWQ